MELPLRLVMLPSTAKSPITDLVERTSAVDVDEVRAAYSRFPPDVGVVDYPGVTRLKDGGQVTELQKARRRVKAVRAIRRSSELEGSRSTDATRADQVRYARGSITAAQLGDRVRRRYNVT